MYWDGQGWAAPQGPPAAAPYVAEKAGKRRDNKIAAAIIGVIVVIFAMSQCGSDDDSKSSSSSSATSSSSSRTQSATTTASVAPAGSAVRDGKFEFQVLGVKRAAQAGDLSNQFETVEPQGEFIIVTMSVKNVGDEARSFSATNQKLIDTAGREYSANSAADMWMNKGTGEINPGNRIQVEAAFDVAPGTVPSELAVHDSMFSGGAIVRL
jgi:hypothetical protein